MSYDYQKYVYAIRKTVNNFNTRAVSSLLINIQISYVDEICALLGCYAALSSSSVPTFWDNLSHL